MNAELSNNIEAACGRGRLNKTEEIQVVKKLIATLPDSYLRDMLVNIETQFASDIRSDFPTVPDIAKLESHALFLEARVAEWTKRRKAIKENHDGLLRDIRHSTVAFEGIKEKAAQLRANVCQIEVAAKHNADYCRNARGEGE
jgi:hypothetical protein